MRLASLYGAITAGECPVTDISTKFGGDAELSVDFRSLFEVIRGSVDGQILNLAGCDRHTIRESRRLAKFLAERQANFNGKFVCAILFAPLRQLNPAPRNS